MYYWKMENVLYGNHPVEMLLPLHHLMEVGFDVRCCDIIWLSS